MVDKTYDEPEFVAGEPEPIEGDTPYLDWATFLRRLDPQRSGGSDRALAVPICVRTELSFEELLECLKEEKEERFLRFDPIDRILNFVETDKSEQRLEVVLYVLAGPLEREYYEIIHVGRPVPIAADESGEAVSFLPAVPDIPGEPRVLMGVVDDGLGFLNARFRTHDRATDTFSSRFAGVWLQAVQGAAAPGIMLDRAAIEGEIEKTRRRAEGKVYADLNKALFIPGMTRSVEQRRSHGSHVADLFAGAPPEPVGAAAHPLHEVPILGVQLPPEVFNDTTGKYLEPWLIAALRWMIATARANGIPRLIVNVSLGFLAGQKDGSSAIEQSIAGQVALASLPIGGRSVDVDVILPSGNDYESRQVAALAPEPCAPASIRLRVQRDDHTPSYVEIRGWDPRDEGPLLGALRVGIRLPAGQSVPPVSTPAGFYRPIRLGGEEIARLYHYPEMTHPGGETLRPFLALAIRYTAASPPNDRLFLLAPGWRITAPAGVWQLTLATDRDETNRVSLQVQRDDTAVGYLRRGRQAYFEDEQSYLRDRRNCSDPWYRETRDYTRISGTSAVRHEGTDNALASRTMEGFHSIGAASIRPWPLGPRSPVEPAPYASEGSEWSRPKPDASAVSETTGVFDGVLAAGTASGSAVRLNGSSVAAPTYGRSLVLPALQVAMPVALQRRLGAFTVVGSDAIRG